MELRQIPSQSDVPAKGRIHWRPQCPAFRPSCGFHFFVALARCGDLLLCAKHLFVAAIADAARDLRRRRGRETVAEVR